MDNTKNTDGIKRQAVVIIHGIGEQRPMDTLRGFVNALLHKENQDKEKKDQPYYSKPDTISDSYELRRIKLKKFEDRETGISINDDWNHHTDFFEYYWAHHMSGTEWWHVFSWTWRILHRSLSDKDENVFSWTWQIIHRSFGDKDSENQKHKAYKNSRNHERLGQLYACIWAIIIVFVLVFITITLSLRVVTITDAPAMLLALLLALTACLMLLPRLRRAKKTIGDAARYLDIAPANIARRYDILRGGKDMLRNLHEQTSKYTEKDKVRYVYDRIVIVGHSLGSIIAYDLLKHYWYEVNGHLPIEDLKAVEETARFDCTGDCPDIGQPHHLNDFRKAQYKLWRYLNRKWLGEEELEEYKAPRARWLITDLITLGSPLSYGALLLADNVDDFKTRTELRELPVCPPDRSRHIRPGQFVVPLDQEADVSAAKSFNILHHGALFAVIRWTNFFFRKDLIAGRINNVFGKGIRDIELIEGPNSWFSSHTSYWDLKSTTCLNYLRAVLKNVRWSDDQGRIFKIVNKNSGRALTISSSSKDNNAACIQYELHDLDDQKFMLFAVDDSYVIANRNSGKVLGIASGSKDNNAACVQWDWAGVADQKFWLERVDQTFYKIVNANSGKVLGIASGSKDNNAHCVQWDWTGVADQLFSLQEVDGGTLRIPEPEAGRAWYDIGDVERITRFGVSPPEETRPVLIGQSLIPYFAVNDGSPGRDRRWQIQHSPYYLFSKYGMWRLVYLYEHDGNSVYTERQMVEVGLIETASQSMERTLGISITAEAGFEYGGASGSLSSTINSELKTTSSTSTEKMKKDGVEVTETFPNVHCVKAKWMRVDRYVVTRMDGAEISHSEIVHKDKVFTDTYPHTTPKLGHPGDLQGTAR